MVRTLFISSGSVRRSIVYMSASGVPAKPEFPVFASALELLLALEALPVEEAFPSEPELELPQAPRDRTIAPAKTAAKSFFFIVLSSFRKMSTQCIIVKSRFLSSNSCKFLCISNCIFFPGNMTNSVNFVLLFPNYINFSSPSTILLMVPSANGVSSPISFRSSV